MMFRYPFLSSEIFNCEHNAILEKFFEAPEIEASQETKTVETEEAEQDDTVEMQEPEEKEVEEDKEKEETSLESGADSDKKEEPAAEESKDEKKDEAAEEPAKEAAKEDTEGKTDEAASEDKKADEESTEEKKEEQSNEKGEPEAETSTEPEAKEEAGDKAETKADIEVEQLDKEETTEETAEATQTTQVTETADSQNGEEEETGKYMLLDRLFKFVRSKDKPLNNVLAGYFSKLLMLLLNRKQKQIIPYVFGADSDVLDCLLYHVYQKSVSEVLNKLMNVVDSNFEPDLVQLIQEKKLRVMNQLTDKLMSDYTEEDNYSAATVICELLEVKEFFGVVSKRANVLKLAECAFNRAGTPESRCSALQVLFKLG